MDSHQRAFTLIELLVTLVIAGVLIVAALPAMSDWIARERARRDTLALAVMIQTARHAAVNLGTPVTVCPGQADQCGRRNTWHLGTLLFTDRNRNRRVDGDDVRLARMPGFEHSRILWRSFRNRSYLRFETSGRTDWQNGHFLICPVDEDAALARQIVLNAAGRLYFSRDEDGDGRHDDVQGRPLTC